MFETSNTSYKEIIRREFLDYVFTIRRGSFHNEEILPVLMHWFQL